MKYHQLAQYLAGKSKQDVGNVSSQKETLDSTVCFLQRRTSVCKPPNYHEKKLWISCWCWQSRSLDNYANTYSYEQSLDVQMRIYILLRRTELLNSWQFYYIPFITSFAFRTWLAYQLELVPSILPVLVWAGLERGCQFPPAGAEMGPAQQLAINQLVEGPWPLWQDKAHLHDPSHFRCYKRFMSGIRHLWGKGHWNKCTF